ncbi:HNH endonuclease, partial [Microcoleus sp. F10_A2]
NGRNQALNAKVEVGDGLITIHSRSGPAIGGRNPDYRKAVEKILLRLKWEDISPSIYLDSRPSLSMSSADRLIVAEGSLVGDEKQQFNQIVRAMNSVPGSSSKGAYRRIEMRTPYLPAYALASIIDASYDRKLSEQEKRQVTRADMLAAIAEVGGKAGKLRHHRFKEATGYTLLTPDGDELPPKEVYGVALSIALRMHITPQHISSGHTKTPFKQMVALGFDILDRPPHKTGNLKVASTSSAAAAATNDLPADEEEQRWAEGDIRIVKHLRSERRRNSKASQEKRKAVIEKHGRLICERCENDFIDLYGPITARGCFDIHHTIPLSEMNEGHETKLTDLQCLCASCHRATHHEMALGKG